MHTFSDRDLEDLSLGAALLGSGGGGDVEYALLLAKKHKNRTVVPLQYVEDDALILPIAWMGAPLVSLEKLPTGDEFLEIINAAEKHFGRPVDYILPAEIGGSNALAPFSLEKDVPIIDGDTLGRAFPTVDSSSCALFGIKPSPAFISGGTGVTRIESNNTADLEAICRKKTVEFGSNAALGVFAHTGALAKQGAIISGTLSYAKHLGVHMCTAKTLANGTILDIDQTIEDGFLMGTFCVGNQDAVWTVHMQNEYLAVFQGKTPIAATPDIISCLEEESKKPIPSEKLRIGARVSIVTLPSPDIWKTKAGLKLTGPKRFDFPFSYEEVVS